MLKIAVEARENTELLHEAPHNSPVSGAAMKSAQPSS
jgi:hypothetical protein